MPSAFAMSAVASLISLFREEVILDKRLVKGLEGREETLSLMRFSPMRDVLS
jgi:hypothetical protein